MAKRARPRSEAFDATATPGASKPPRLRATRERRDLASGSRPGAVDAGAPQGTAAGSMASDAVDSGERAPSEEEIRMRAYHRYLERGGGHGMDFEDWLEAERELKEQK